MKRVIWIALAVILMLGGCGSHTGQESQITPEETASKAIVNTKIFKGSVTVTEIGSAGPVGKFVNTLISIDYLYLDKERNSLRILERKMKYTSRIETALDAENEGAVAESGELTEVYGFDAAPTRFTFEDGIFIPDPQRKSTSWVSETMEFNTEAGDFTEVRDKTDVTLLAHPIELLPDFDYKDDFVKFDKEYEAASLMNVTCNGTIACEYTLASQDEIDSLLARLPNQSQLSNTVDWTFDLSQLAEKEHESMGQLLSVYKERESGLADLTQDLLDSGEYPESLGERLDSLEERADEAYRSLTDDITAFNEIIPDMYESSDEEVSSLAKAAALYEDSFEVYTDEFSSDLSDLIQLEDDLGDATISEEDHERIQALFDEIETKLGECEEEADLLMSLSEDSKRLAGELEESPKEEQTRLLDEFFREWNEKMGL